MTCGQVRERLSEHALGLLSEGEASAIERHLEWCGGCRKEFGELQEGLAALAMGLPPASPPASLEARVVARVTTAAGRRPATVSPRRRGRAVAGMALAAVLTAVLAVGWAVAEHRRAGNAEARMVGFETQLKSLQALVDQFGGRQAPLRPRAGAAAGSGFAVLIHLEDQPDMAIVEVLLPNESEMPYTVRLRDDQGQTRLSFQLEPTNNGTLALLYRTDRDLRHVVRVQVLDGADVEVLSGDVQPLASPR
jgi:hypothetical protein